MKTSRNTGSIGRPKHNNRTPSRCRSGGGFLLPADLVAETEETDWSRVSRWPYFNPQGGRPRRNPETTCFCRQCTRRDRTCQGLRGARWSPLPRPARVGRSEKHTFIRDNTKPPISRKAASAEGQGPRERTAPRADGIKQRSVQAFSAHTPNSFTKIREACCYSPRQFVQMMSSRTQAAPVL